MNDFLKANQECLEFSDGCSFCAVDGSHDVLCSTPQIACVLHDYQCTSPKPN